MLCLFNKMMTIVDKYKGNMKDMDYIDMCNYLKIMKSIYDKEQKYVCHYFTPVFRYSSASKSIRVSYKLKKKIVLCRFEYVSQLLDGSKKIYHMDFDKCDNGDTVLVNKLHNIYKEFECGNDTDDEEQPDYIGSVEAQKYIFVSLAKLT